MLKDKYKVRLLIDDTCAFGVLGENGRGIVEHYGCNMEDIDMISASLEYSCSAYGGFCTGTHYIIDHQRLSGLGYCFSASLPPLQAAAGLRAIKLLRENNNLVSKLKDRCIRMSKELQKYSDIITVSGIDISPIKHLRFTNSMNQKYRSKNSDNSVDHDLVCLEKVVEYVSFQTKYLLKKNSN